MRVRGSAGRWVKIKFIMLCAMWHVLMYRIMSSFRTNREWQLRKNDRFVECMSCNLNHKT